MGKPSYERKGEAGKALAWLREATQGIGMVLTCNAQMARAMSDDDTKGDGNR